MAQDIHAILSKALNQYEWLHFRYTDSNGLETYRKVFPRAVTPSYLIGYCDTDRATRHFLVWEMRDCWAISGFDARPLLPPGDGVFVRPVTDRAGRIGEPMWVKDPDPYVASGDWEIVSLVDAPPLVRHLDNSLVGANLQNIDQLLALPNPPARIWWDTPGIEFCLVPAGERCVQPFPKSSCPNWGLTDQDPAEPLPAFYMAKTPVTNAQFAHYVRAAGYVPGDWPGGEIPQGKEDHPVVNVSLFDAEGFCNWAGCSLPTVWYWRKAAFGTDGRIYPWGSQWQAGRCNTVEARVDDTTPVTRYPAGASPDGLLDTLGNVREWTSDLHFLEVEEDNIHHYNYVLGGSFLYERDKTLELDCSKVFYGRQDLGFRPVLET